MSNRPIILNEAPAKKPAGPPIAGGKDLRRMPRLKKIFIAAIVVFCVLMAGFAAFLNTAFSPEFIQLEITKKIKEATAGELAAAEYRLVYFPFLHVEIKKAEWFLPEDRATSLKADRLRMGLDVWRLLRKNIQISQFQIENASLETPRFYPVLQEICAGCFVPTVRLQGLGMDFKFRKGRRALEFHISSGGSGKRRLFDSKGFLQGKTPLESLWNLKDRHLQLALEIRGMPLGFLQQALSDRLGFRFKSGFLYGKAGVTKEAGQDFLQAQTDLKIQEMVYEVLRKETFVPAPVINVEVNSNMTWNMSTQELAVKNSRIFSPLGELRFAGSYFSSERRFKEMRVTGTGIVLDALPSFWFRLKEMVPLNVGFSGKSDFQWVLDGKWADKLTWHGHWDMSSMILGYSRYFSKPKDMPMSLAMELLFEKGEKLSGNFSVHMSEISMKGTLTDISLRYSKGDVNILTNKFSLKGREALFPFLERFTLDGQTKFLAHWSGRLFDSQASQKMLTLILEDGSFIREDGVGLKGVDFYLDYGPSALEVRKAGFELGQSRILFSAVIRGLLDDPTLNAEIQSPYLIPESFFEELDLLLPGRLNEKQKGYYQQIKQGMRFVFPNKNSLEDFKAKIRFKENKWTLDHMNFRAYDGKARFKGEMDFHVEDPNLISPVYQIEGEIERWSLARLLAGGKWQNSITGNLFVKGVLQGNGINPEGWEERVTAGGKFSITNGELLNVNLLGTLAEIPKFRYLKEFNSATTPFDDIQSDFMWDRDELALDKSEPKKFITKNLVLVSRDLYADGEGDISKEGILNYRLNVYLPTGLMEDQLASLIGKLKKEGEKRLGPIPFLLSGPLSQPELKADPALLPQILEEIEKKKTQRIFRNFLPEDAFLERSTSS